MKQQVNVRLSEATRAKLDWLTERYGTQAEVVAVAVDRLFTQQLAYKGEIEMNEYKGYEIKVGFTQDGIFGPDEDNVEGVDVMASINNYTAELTKLLRCEFPGASVCVVNGIEDYHRVWPEDFESPDMTVEVGEVIHRFWESWSWVIH